ncbi:MAG: hypothetical protein JWR26_4829 [Pedosphaera sp.]|nr:hypothetical protein [Pedosphaera sp.]
MSTPVQSWPSAWEPLTPRGVAAFAGASLGRLLLVQCIVALLAAGAVVWVLERAWFPAVRAAIHQLPEEGSVSGGQLGWAGESPVQLSGNHFLGLAVDLNHSGRLGREAQLQLEFGRKNLRVFSLLGYVVIDYPLDWRIAFNRTELDPWWGAWEPGILAGAAGITFLVLMLSWTVLATLYCIPVRLVTFYENRDLNWRQSWRLAGAALMPGALFLIVGIVCYGLGWMDLIQLGAVHALHFVIGWIYLLISPLFLSRHPDMGVTKSNPFAAAKESKTKKSG